MNQKIDDQIKAVLISFMRNTERYYGGRTVGKTLNGEEAHQAIQKLVVEGQPDLTNIKAWVKQGLDPKYTNSDVPYRCLQMIDDELKALKESIK